MSNEHPRPEIAFHCTRKQGGCGARFTASEYSTEPFPEQDWHPWEHSAACPKCGESAPQASWQLAAWKSASKPKPLEARIVISIANQQRDPSSYAVSRFNAIVHGASAKTAKYYPARPGHYDICEHCEYLMDGCGTAWKHCAKRTELFVQYSLAQEEGDGSLLGALMAETQAGLAAITGDMIRNIAVKGVALEVPVFSKGENRIEIATWQDEDGKERTLTRLEAHPLLPHLINFIQKNTMTLGDMGLTPRAKEETQQFKGFLDAKDADRETLQEATRTQQDLVNKLLGVVGHARVIDGGVIEEGEIADAG